VQQGHNVSTLPSTNKGVETVCKLYIDLTYG
jgi:hypothetical protein